MEGLITLIVIIIIFNLLNRLVNAAKRQQQPSTRRRRSYGFERSLPGRAAEKKVEDPAYFRPEDAGGYYARYEDEEGAVEEVDEADKLEGEKGLEVKRAVRKKAPAEPASNSLRQILSNRDSLVAAFIFHEALSGPPVSRRKKKTALNRFR